MEKITLNSPESHSAELISHNLAQLAQLFPEAFTEGKIDFDVLKQLLGGAVDDRDEKYGLNWHGKRKARQLALTPSTGTLRPCPEESVDWDTTQNLMIEGDNLEVLKLLQKSYAGKVKLIYIDPPYNTGKDFVYPDNFVDNIKNYLELTGQVEGGRKISSNTEASGRFHTDWLNMMYPRLKLARNLMRNDGVIFVSIDDCELSRLQLLLDDVFGEENFITTFAWRTDGNFDNQAKIKVCHEYVLVYGRDASVFEAPPVVDPSIPRDSKIFNPEIRNTVVKNSPKNPVSTITLPPGFPSALNEGVISKRQDAWPRYSSDAVIENGKLINEVVVESGWSCRDLVVEYIVNGFNPVHDTKGQATSFEISSSGAIEAVKQRSAAQSHVISVLNGFGGSQKATAELSAIGAFFNGYPKPRELLEYFLQMAAKSDDIVLDFFAGSGSLGHAVMSLNARSNQSIRFLLVQLPEKLSEQDPQQSSAASYCSKIGVASTIAELTKERLRRSGEKIKQECPLFIGDQGFRVFKLDSSSLHTWESEVEDLETSLFGSVEHIKSDRSEDDLLYELLLKLGLDLCVPIERRALAGKTVHSVGGGVLMACLDTPISQDEADSLATQIVAWHSELAPASDTTCIFRDSAFENDVAKTNMALILQQHGIANVRSL